MLWLYRILFLPFLVFSSPYYLLRMKRRGGYRRHFSQRLGTIEGLPQKHMGIRRIWLQAVSVGEMLAIAPLLEAFKHDSSVEFYITTTTSTGYKLARERYQEYAAGIGYFPIDWWLFSARAWKRIQPDLVILTEGERWPEHVHQAARRGVRVISVNSRLSDRSYRRMKQWKWAAAPMLQGIGRVLACSEFDAQRFRELGYAPERISVTGNIKLDLTLPQLTEPEKRLLRAQLGLGSDAVLIGASTWPGEEVALVRTLRRLREVGVNCRLLIVPRHAERRKDVEGLLRDSGFMYHFRTRGSAAGIVDVSVADTTGELRRLTQLADLVFVGKSLPPHDQGQTPVEAAALGRAMIFGPGMSNFRVIAQDLLACGAARQVADSTELAETALTLFHDPAQRTAMADAALNWHRSNQGAVARTVEILQQELAQLAIHPPADSRTTSRR